MANPDRAYRPASAAASTASDHPQQVDPQLLAMFKQELGSTDTARRHRAATKMSEIKESWVIKLANEYLHDNDPIVSDCAKKACKRFSFNASKAKWRFKSKNSDVLIETYPIATFVQLIDEVIFIIQHNLSGIAFNAILAAIPKLIFILVLYLGAAQIYPDITVPIANTEIICLLTLLHQIFWRPVIWLNTGLSVMAGFPDKAARAISRKPEPWKNYRLLLAANMVEAICFSAVFTLGLMSYQGSATAEGMIIFAGIIWLFFYAATSTMVPYNLLTTSEPLYFSGTSLQFDAYPKSFNFSIKLAITIGILFLVITASTIAMARIIGIDTWAVANRFSPTTAMLCLIITADCFIDPFIIAYRLLLTKLFMSKAR